MRLTVIAIVLALAAGPLGLGQSPSAVTPEMLQGLEWRWIGPAAMGGRVTAVAGVPGNPAIVYVAHSSGGLFKSTNGGTTFRSIFDDETTLSIGALAVSLENPEVIYVGTGEGNPRNSASYGDGIYKSVDGGKTWKHLGLEHTERFARIVVNPRYPQVVLAAAMGHEWASNPERGVYRSSDGGLTWKQVLYVNETTGASDVQLDPRNPNVVYAGMFDYLRQPWHLRSGGPGSGLYRSSDGGESWVKLTDPKLANGLPSGILGRVGVAVSASSPNVVYALIPSEKGLLWSSTDDGEKWEMVNNDPQIDVRPFYFSQVRVDPVDANRIYSLAGGLFLSVDGGRSFRPLSGGGDNHDLWIDSTNPNRLLLGSDMGFDVSHDRGATWDFVNNLPFGQVYGLGFDMAEPYHVMAGLQDHEVWWGPSSKWSAAGATNADWKRLLPWGDGQYAMADPRDPNVIYFDGHFGDLHRLDLRTGEARSITPYPVLEFGAPAGAFRYWFNWNAPFYLSPHNPDVIYFGGNVLFKTTNGGESWEAVSPDLTTHDPEKMKISGEPFWQDITNAESYCTITAISEDGRDAQVVWVGTDDGNIQLTRDGGRHWTNVASRIPGLAANSRVSSIEAAPHDPGRAYVSLDRHPVDDFAPYVYVTADYGQTWSRISQGLPSYVHVVREDPRQPNLLYTGTELGIYASLDRGKTWTDLRLGLPRLPVYDLFVHPRDNDLVIGTHGRGVYILDDVTPLQHLAEAAGDPVALFKPMPATRFQPTTGPSPVGARVFVAPNKPFGALISYYLSKTSEDAQKIILEIRDVTGKRIRTIEGTTHPGINRVVWDLREEPPGGTNVVQDKRADYIWYPLALRGPRVLPGKYTVSLLDGDRKLPETLTVRLDPRWKVSRDELVAQQQAVRRLLEMQERAQVSAGEIESLSAQLQALERRLADPKLKNEAANLEKTLATIAGELANPQDGYRAPAKLIEQIAYLRYLVDGATGRPTAAQSEWIENNSRQLAYVLTQLDKVVRVNLADLNARLRSAGIPYVGAAK